MTEQHRGPRFALLLLANISAALILNSSAVSAQKSALDQNRMMQMLDQVEQGKIQAKPVRRPARRAMMGQGMHGMMGQGMSGAMMGQGMHGMMGQGMPGMLGRGMPGTIGQGMMGSSPRFPGMGMGSGANKTQIMRMLQQKLSGMQGGRMGNGPVMEMIRGRAGGPPPNMMLKPMTGISGSGMSNMFGQALQKNKQQSNMMPAMGRGQLLKGGGLASAGRQQPSSAFASQPLPKPSPATKSMDDLARQFEAQYGK
ncbi:MAG TPA: hypothetical protein V6D17_23005 [Candidatus Obscuribacterales bacterium]